MTENDLPVGHSHSDKRLNEVALSKGEHLRPGKPGDRRPGGDPKGEDDCVDRGAQNGDEHDREQERRMVWKSSVTLMMISSTQPPK